MHPTRVLLAAVALLAAAPLHAQSADSTRAASVLSAACPGARVRLYLAGDSLEGVCGPVLDGRLVVRRSGAERAVPLESVREVWLHERQTKRGVIIGAGAGAVVMSLAAVTLVGAFCESSNCAEDYVNVVPFGAVVGGAAGGLIGAGIGYLTREWKRRYP